MIFPSKFENFNFGGEEDIQELTTPTAKEILKSACPIIEEKRTKNKVQNKMVRNGEEVSNNNSTQEAEGQQQYFQHSELLRQDICHFRPSGIRRNHSFRMGEIMGEI